MLVRPEPGGRARDAAAIAHSGEILVWDLPVRLMFLGIVLLLPVVWVSAYTDTVAHALYAVPLSALVAARLIWGVIGSRFARLSDFLYSPITVVRYIRDVTRFTARRYVGHDPLTGLLSFLTLATLGAMLVSGWLMPQKPEQQYGWLIDVHKHAPTVLAVLIPFLILAKLISSWLHGESVSSLLREMVTGWKRHDASDVLADAVRTAEFRLHDRMRAIETLAMLTLLSGAALGLGLWFRAPADLRTALSARAPQPPPAVVQVPAVNPAERQAIRAEIEELRAAALREVAAAKAEAEREIAARAKAVAAEQAAASPPAVPAPPVPAAAPTVSPRDLERIRDQLRSELMAELQRQQAARPVATPQSAPTMQVREQAPPRAFDEASIRQLLSARGSDRAALATILAAGGRLYDDLFAAQGKTPPRNAHPAWPAGRQAASAGDTWRCSSCHGYDYRGDPGTARLGGGGVPFHSVRNAERMSIDQVIAVLGDARHGYTDDILPRNAKLELAAFLVRGQYTANRYFSADGKAKGVAARGRERYQTACASCHGPDGKLAVKPNGPSLGAIATQSPPEMFHKIRNGHPGAINAAMRPIPLSAQTDLLAYIQTLPR